MSFNDPVADMLTRVRNGSSAAKEVVEMPHSRLKNEIARILKKEGYIRDYSTENEGGKKILRIFLKYTVDQTPAIACIQRVSKPGLRKFVGSADIPRVLGGMGIAIISTSSGILTDKQARKAHVGGEILCSVW